jgi:UDP-GlcNAc3NAcA epimerase
MKKLRLASIVGARPQFVKAAMVSQAISQHNRTARMAKIEEILIHTGQHYDYDMSQVFFDQMKIPAPQRHLVVGSASHARMTADMLVRIEEALAKEKPDCVLVYGDTNSTLAGALSAAKIPLPVAHVEAGLRSYNRRMPEEINRLLTDHLSRLLFCPTPTAVSNLRKEGIGKGVFEVGDVMYDAFVAYQSKFKKNIKILRELQLSPGRYCLATVHRQENTDDSVRLRNIFAAFDHLASQELPLIIPVHPRTRAAIQRQKQRVVTNVHVRLLAPVNYLDMIVLESHARAILTDSGGIQKEAFFARVPCVTLRDETEWVETVSAAMNQLSGTDPEAIILAFGQALKTDVNRCPGPEHYYGDGHASQRILDILAKTFS